MKTKIHALLGNARRINAVLVIALALYFLIAPLIMCIHFLNDPRLREGRPPTAAYFLHKQLSPTYAAWARDRVASGRAAKLSKEQFVATEWPIFGTVFYLWATESLQQDWEKETTHTGAAPKDYAHDAIEACAALVADPGHAGWVKQHYGDAYLTRDDAFYRMLLIGGLTSYQRLTGNAQYEPIVRAQVDSLSTELDTTKSGLLDDYPGECYPGDVMAAVYAIQQADEILHTDHSAFVEHMKRGFTGGNATKLGVPPFWAVAKSGLPLEPARGSSNSYMCLTGPQLWPEEARRWYALHTQHFWQEGPLLAGFREYTREDKPTQFEDSDMDSGPIVLGFGFAATAFGTGAALANGDLDRGEKLLAEMLPGAWPLPNGALLIPRVLSDAGDAPYLGEACILYNMTRTPAPKAVLAASTGQWPGLVYLLLACYGVPGVLAITFAARVLVEKLPAPQRYRRPRLQFALWLMVLCAAGITAFFNIKIALMLLLLTQFLPRLRPAPAPHVIEGFWGEHYIPDPDTEMETAKI